MFVQIRHGIYRANHGHHRLQVYPTRNGWAWSIANSWVSPARTIMCDERIPVREDAIKQGRAELIRIDDARRGEVRS